MKTHIIAKGGKSEKLKEFVVVDIDSKDLKIF